MMIRATVLGVVLFASLCVSVGCQSFLAAREDDIRYATQAIATARDDVQRAKAYSSRGAAYSEKARYNRIMKLIPHDEYEHLFDLAMKDHDQAVALNPASSEIYFNRAQANYDRGSLDLLETTNGSAALRDNPAFNAAAMDFEKATQEDPRNDRAFDMLGLTYEQNSLPDKAIEAYTHEMALNLRLGRMRLADAYCMIGFQHQQQNDLAGAARAYRRSIEFGVADDKSCPVVPLAEIEAMARGGYQ
jgi:tetratricopeptide (TPR) repeat protein